MLIIQCNLIILNIMKSNANQYEIGAIVSIDGRGQIVLPKEAREALALEAGTKLAVVIKRTAGGVPCCINLVPAKALESSIREVLESAAISGGAQ